MGVSVRTTVAFAGCFCVFVGVTCYFIYVYRIRRAARLRSQRAEEAASRFYAELLAQHERDRAARAAAADYETDGEDELLDLDERIPFLVCLPDNSLHVALLDEELSHRAPGAVNAVHLPARLASYDARGTSAAPLPQPDEPFTGQVDLQTAFIAPPSSGDSSSPPPPQLPIGTLPTAAASADPPQPDPAREAPLPPAEATPPDSVAADRETMSQRLWRLGSAVFTGAGDAPDADLPPNVIWTVVAVPPSLLPTALTTAPERTATLRGSLWRPTRSFHHQLSGALGLNRAESSGSSWSMFGRSHTEAPGDSTVHIPMHMHPEEEFSSDDGSEEESAGIAAAYPEGTWPESQSPRRRGRSGRFQRADSARSMSRRGSASGRLASLSKSLSQALAFPGSERRDRYAAAAAAAPAAAAADGALPPHTVAVALPVM